MKHGQLKDMVDQSRQKLQYDQQHHEARKQQRRMHDALHQRTRRKVRGIGGLLLQMFNKAVAAAEQLQLFKPLAEGRVLCAVRGENV